MIKRIRLNLFGVALLTCATPILFAAARPAAAQSSFSSAKKKKKTVTTATKTKGKSKGRVAARPKGQAAPTADRIKEIQSALQKDGSYDGEPTGKWDAATTDAMKKYQDKNGVNPTGKIDAVSLNKLGLGSETAGKGAPIPAANSSTAPAPASKPSTSVSPTSE
ncbi:MAG TPA: peptidoglycan-binding domain-containing protein [Candidatus Acidoferrales bacterium]|jgi:peptidoglycan hydrolase-like protein with peptidoglycan-binding domain|nr:peptidoglycan-binding domain-containing protein [Candidatus Acidoferrales bacterium]